MLYISYVRKQVELKNAGPATRALHTVVPQHVTPCPASTHWYAKSTVCGLLCNPPAFYVHPSSMVAPETATTIFSATPPPPQTCVNQCCSTPYKDVNNGCNLDATYPSSSHCKALPQIVEVCSAASCCLSTTGCFCVTT